MRKLATLAALAAIAAVPAMAQSPMPNQPGLQAPPARAGQAEMSGTARSGAPAAAPMGAPMGATAGAAATTAPRANTRAMPHHSSAARHHAAPRREAMNRRAETRASRNAAVDRGATTPDVNKAYMGGGMVMEGAPGAPAPAPMQTAPAGSTRPMPASPRG